MSTVKFDKPATLDPQPLVLGLDGVQLIVIFGQSQGVIIAPGPTGPTSTIRVPVDLSTLNLDAVILAALGAKFQVQATKFDPPVIPAVVVGDEKLP